MSVTVNYIKQIEQQNEELQARLAEFENHQMLRIPTLEEGMYDKDDIMLHACFTLLCKYVEEECNGNIPKCEEDDFKAAQTSDEERRMRHDNECIDELMNLYRWWKKEYPELWCGKNGKSSLEKYEIEQKKLGLLIELRGYLWT